MKDMYEGGERGDLEEIRKKGKKYNYEDKEEEKETLSL